jgi:ArsR family transcriptional regulator
MTNLRIKNRSLDEAARLGKAIDHPLRVRAIAALRERELCVCELIEIFDLSPSTVSKHMSVIAESGLVNRRREGKWTYYSLPVTPEAYVKKVLSAVMELVEDDPTILRDRKRISNITCSRERT